MMLNELINLIKPANQRKVTLKQVKTIIKQLHQHRTQLSLGQKYSYLVMLSKIFVSANRNFLNKITRLSKNMFSIPSNDQTKKKIYNRTTQKKPKIEVKEEQTKIKISVEQIANNLLQSNRKMMVHQPIEQCIDAKQQLVIQKVQEINIPPFSPQMMTKISQDLQMSFKSFSQSDTNSKLKNWQPQLLNYKQWLPITQQNINKTIQKLPRIKGAKTTQKKKRIIHIQDQSLDMPNDNQNFSISVQKLATKIKNYEEMNHQQGAFVRDGLNFLLPILIDSCLLRDKIFEDDSKINRKKYFNSKIKSRSGSHYSFDHDIRNFDINQYKSQLKTPPKDFYIIQEDNAALTARLQTTICEAIDYQHFSRQKISLISFCQDRGISREVKGQLFYQLLHLPYTLTQNNADSFGDIFILKN